MKLVVMELSMNLNDVKFEKCSSPGTGFVMHCRDVLDDF